ncbi:MAG: 5-(carboxyamino)imidazole ribonucleotide mutase [Desulfohalobiaceae bacterium]|nr:5-(carboxyamino)imidazole ribonucleotide mutase [Desulfohalobiaceae bacterium]
MPQVAVLIGSISDRETLQPCLEILDELGVDYAFTVTSAHRTPDRTRDIVRDMEEAGCQVFICAAGLAAHLAGAVASKTTRPVLGVPVSASSLGGMDALLSTVQMPPGFPVGTMGLDRVGARNAAWMAVQILALRDEGLRERLEQSRQRMADKVARDAEGLSG